MRRYDLYLTGKDKVSKDITQLVQSLSWSGDIRQIARELTATLAAPQKGLTLPLPELFDSLILRVDGVQVFVGTVVTRRRASTGNTMDLTALDGGWRLVQNQGFYKFKNVSADEGARIVCRDFGIPVGKLASGGGKYSRKFPGAGLHSIIYTMYTFAEKDTGARYLPRFNGSGAFEVIEKPKTASFTIAPRVNSQGIEITEDISKLVTMVKIYTDDGKLVRTVTGEAFKEFPIPLQQILTQRKGTDAKKEADAILEDNGLKQTMAVDCLGSRSLITGNAVILHENSTGAKGLCWIDSDTHTFKNGQYFCNLQLNYRNLMNQETGGSELT